MKKKRGRPTKWTDEQREILDKVHHTNVRKYTVEVLTNKSIEELKILKYQLEGHKDNKMSLTESLEYDSMIKNVDRVISLKLERRTPKMTLIRRVNKISWELNRLGSPLILGDLTEKEREEIYDEIKEKRKPLEKELKDIKRKLLQEYDITESKLIELMTKCDIPNLVPPGYLTS